MSPERPQFEARQPIEPPLVLPEAFIDALKNERPDNLNWDRIDEAVAVLKKPPEPEPTKSQAFFREMYQTGDKSPYKVKRGPVKFNALKVALKEEFTHPIEFVKHAGEHIMAVDKDFRGGVEIGDMKTRATRAAVMVGNMVPNIALDILTSIPPNLLEKAAKEHLNGKLKVATGMDIGDKDREPLISKLNFQIAAVSAAGRTGEVMNDKNVTAFGNTIMRRLTGERTGWFTGESSDKLNDLLTAGYRESVEDFVNGPTLESALRILYQVPVAGALVEQVWTRWTNFQSKSEYHKGNLKGVYAGIGLLIWLLRGVQADSKTPSWRITNAIWNSDLSKKIRGVSIQTASTGAGE